jgi:pimeloyl-ACP methyl ester carboxylesterase
VYGLSYGTRLALTLLRRHPERIRSVVLDSVVPPQVDELAATTENAAEAIQRLLDRCAAEARCRRAYPDLSTALREAVERLEHEPLPLGDGLSLDGGGLLRFVYFALYDAKQVPRLPRAIQAAREGRLDPLWPSVAQVQRQIALLVAAGAHLSWVCNEQVPFTTPARIDAVDRRFPDVAWVFSPRGVLGLCRAVRWPRPSAAENRATRSDVPTLLVTGRFDPVSPVEWARLASHSLSRGRVVVFPTLAHGVFNQSACVRRIALAFLDAPLLHPDTSCVGRLPPVAWARPR